MDIVINDVCANATNASRKYVYPNCTTLFIFVCHVWKF